MRPIIPLPGALAVPACARSAISALTGWGALSVCAPEVRAQPGAVGGGAARAASSVSCQQQAQSGGRAWLKAGLGIAAAGGLAAAAAAATSAAEGPAPKEAKAAGARAAPPSAEDLSQEGAYSIRTSQAIEGKLGGAFGGGPGKAAHPYAHPDPHQTHDAQGLRLVAAGTSAAPAAPPPCGRAAPAHVVAELESVNRTINISPLHKYRAWTFNGQVPGPMIRCRVGDVLELRHTNRDEDGIGHNVDVHSITGPGGGAAVTYADVGETKVATFKMLHPGAFVYHCAAAPLPTHVANGMYGLMVVEPEGGLPPVDKEFYVMQSEFYGEGSQEERGFLDYSYFEGLKEAPTYVVFNGTEGEHTERAPLIADQGDRVRIWFGNAGPNLPSSFHVIGGIFDKVYRDADLVSPPARSIQTVLVPPGGAAVVELDLPVPGALTLIDHAIFRTDKGAVAFLKVRPKGDDKRQDIYDSADPPNPCPGCKMHN